MLKRIHLIFFLNFIFGCIRSFVGSSFHSRAPTLKNDFRLISNLDVLIKKFFEADDRVLYECTLKIRLKSVLVRDIIWRAKTWIRFQPAS